MNSFPLPVRFYDRRAVVILPDEIDLTNADAVGGTLLALLDQAPSGVIADMTGTWFCDAAGVRAIVRAQSRTRSPHGRLRVVMAHPAVRRVFTLTGADRLVRGYPTLDQALDQAPSAPQRGGPGDGQPDHGQLAPERQTAELIALVRQARCDSRATRSHAARVFGQLAATYAEMATASERLAQRTARNPEYLLTMSRIARDKALGCQDLIAGEARSDTTRSGISGTA